MWRFILCISALCVCVHTITVRNCSVHGEDGTFYTMIVNARPNDPQRPIVDRKTNVLYFNHYIIDTKKRVSAKYELGKEEYDNIDGIKRWCSHAVDQRSGDLYLGCIDGLYHYDSNVDRFVLIGAEDENVQYVFFGNYLYYITHPEWRVRMLTLGESRLVPQLENTPISKIVVDGAGDFIYNNQTSMCRLKPKTGQVQCKDRTSTWMATGPSGDVFDCSNTYHGAIYKIEEDLTPRKVVKAPDCGGLAIDADGNFVYVDGSQITQLIKC